MTMTEKCSKCGKFVSGDVTIIATINLQTGTLQDIMDYVCDDCYDTIKITKRGVTKWQK